MAVSLWYTLWPLLPDVETLRAVQLQTPLRVYSRNSELIREFGEKRRVPLTIDQVPDEIKNALMEQVQQFPGQEREVYEFYQKNPEAVAELRAPIFLAR